MDTGTDGDDGKKVGAIKHSKAGMVADDGMKEDGAEAVPEGVKGAAAHAPAAEGVPQPVPDALPPNAEGEMEGWTFAPRKEWNENRTRAACMVWNIAKGGFGRRPALRKVHAESRPRERALKWSIMV